MTESRNGGGVNYTTETTNTIETGNGMIETARLLLEVNLTMATVLAEDVNPTDLLGMGTVEKCVGDLHPGEAMRAHMAQPTPASGDLKVMGTMTTEDGMIEIEAHVATMNVYTDDE